MKKIVYFLMMCLYALGVIVGVGYCLHSGAYLIAVGVAAVGWMAWPKVVEYFHKLTE
jgi:hypothetical protein